MKDVVLAPQEILALYASPAQLEKGETVMLGDVQSQNQNIFLVAETTCPLARSEEDNEARFRPATATMRPQSVLDMDDFVDDEEGDRVQRRRSGREGTSKTILLQINFF
jgi:hypothetical protein